MSVYIAVYYCNKTQVKEYRPIFLTMQLLEYYSYRVRNRKAYFRGIVTYLGLGSLLNMS